MRLATFFRPIRRHIVRLISEFDRDQSAVRASGLAFSSLLALVPVSALLFSLFSSLGSFAGIVESIQAFLIRTLVPTRQEEILEYVTQFVANTRGLGVFGLLVFLATSILLLAAIQRTFDAVWGTPSRKNTLRKFATYVSILIVGSFILSIGLNITGILSAFLDALFPRETGWVQGVFLNVFPVIFLFAALFFMIRFVPAGPVQSTSALVGAAVGAVLWEVARLLFVFFANYVIRWSVMYGSPSKWPTFTSTGAIGEGGMAIWEREPAEFLYCGLELYFSIAEEFAQGNAPPSTASLGSSLALPERDVEYLLKRFTNSRLLIATGERPEGFVPSRDLGAISTEEVLKCVFGSRSHGSQPDSKTEQLYGNLIRGAIDSIHDGSIKDVIDAGSLPSPDTGKSPKKAAQMHGVGRAVLAKLKGRFGKNR